MIDDLAVILNEGESYTVEFKETPDKSLPTEVCAFANASGGKVFVGVDDSGQVVGTDVSNATRSRVQDTINKIEPRLKVDIVVQDNIMIITVPEETHKPYSCSQGFYLRSGPNSQKLERDSIIEFFQNEGRIRYDEIIRDDLPVAERFNESAYKMKRATRNAKVAEPVFELANFFKVTFKRNAASQSTVSSGSQAVATTDRQAIASDGQAIKMSDRKRAILSYIETHSQITASEVADFLGLSKGRVRAILHEMTGDETIEKVGNNRYAYYVLKKK